MKHYIYFLFAILSVTAYAQKVHTLDKEMVYHVSTDSLLDEIDFKEIFEEYNYVPLKLTPEYTLGEVKQLLATEDRLFVVTDGIYCYDFKGNPIYNITNKGHARNEYITCRAVSICESLIYMYDMDKLQIHVYEVSTGKFLYNISCPCVDYIYKIGKGFVVEDLLHFYIKSPLENIKSRFFVYDEDLSTMKYRAMGKEQHLCKREQPTSLGNGCVLFSDIFEGKVYKIQSDKVISYLQIDCNPKCLKTPQQIHQALNSANISQNHLEAVQHVCETESHIYGCFILCGKRYQFVFDKKSRHCKVFHRFKDTTPYMCSESLTDRRFANNNLFLLAFTPERVKLHLKFMEPIPKSHPEYKQYQKLLNCKPDDNPIIAIYKFRSF